MNLLKVLSSVDHLRCSKSIYCFYTRVGAVMLLMIKLYIYIYRMFFIVVYMAVYACQSTIWLIWKLMPYISPNYHIVHYFFGRWILCCLTVIEHMHFEFSHARPIYCVVKYFTFLSILLIYVNIFFDLCIANQFFYYICLFQKLIYNDLLTITANITQL